MWLMYIFPSKMLILSIKAHTIFHSNREAGKLFSESYQNVAVMFASLPNYIDYLSAADDKKPLNILHEIISKFDQVEYILIDQYC